MTGFLTQSLESRKESFPIFEYSKVSRCLKDFASSLEKSEVTERPPFVGEIGQ